ncbi:hypothetical protein BKA67DRAFT_588344 [Truncatella angustata]|uniref:Uncharacterized protein n=1 Tax=Truncatella angustata TaxID=152316 RepID=A0A9P8U7X6_9PEZI|nr:uncharacterized protein BKA67DRAFT_588344 [Truncatella angustata]KAH6640039.1 hypothetical protein BKA67DRAFT_588344 [Truncatella angustata]
MSNRTEVIHLTRHSFVPASFTYMGSTNLGSTQAYELASYDSSSSCYRHNSLTRHRSGTG